MIKINDIIISDIKDFRDYFDLDQMLKVAHLISIDPYMMSGEEECEAAQDALRAVIEGSPLTAIVDNGILSWTVGAISGKVATSSTVAPEHISQIEAQKILLCTLGAREYVPSENITSQEVPHGAMHCGQTYHYIMADACTLGQLIPMLVSNCSISGDSKLIFDSKDAQTSSFDLPAGRSVVLLTKGNKVAAVVPMDSSNGRQSLWVKYLADGEVSIMSTDLSSGQTKALRTLTARICQVCADSSNGFVALADGKILTYSSIVGPDAVDDMYIPDDEQVVMIAISGSQIMALTDKGRAYSNFPNQQTSKDSILRLSVLTNGQIICES